LKNLPIENQNSDLKIMLENMEVRE